MEMRAACVSLLLVVLLVGLSESSPRRSCCVQYHETPIPVEYLKYYNVQGGTDFCNLKAVIFMTVRGRRVCANPDSEWVIEARKTVPEKPIRIPGGHLRKSS